MSWMPKAGDHVNCPLGEATVRLVQPDKIFIRIVTGRFENQIIAYPAAEFFLKVKPVVVLDVPIPQGPPAFFRIESGDGRIRQKQCIDALRFGLVPAEYINELTLGYPDLNKWVLNSLPGPNTEESPVVHNLVGDYGEGKSHAMSVIRYIALKEGYLVGKIEVDGTSVTLSDPKTLLYMLMTSLKARNLPSTMPLLNLYLKAIRSEKFQLSKDIAIAPKGMDRVQRMCKLIETIDRHNLIDQSEYILDVILTASDEMTAGEVKRALIEETQYVIDQFTQVNPMIGIPVKDRPYDFLEALIGTADIATKAGYKGFVITIDEMEVESRFLDNKIRRERTRDLFNVLLQYFNGKTDHPDVPLAIYFASVFEEQDTVPEEVLKQISELVGISGGSKREIESFRGWNPGNAEQVSLVKKIHQIYKEAYPCNELPDDVIVKNLTKALRDTGKGESGGIRSFMKQYISYLDSIYGPPYGTFRLG